MQTDGAPIGLDLSGEVGRLETGETTINSGVGAAIATPAPQLQCPLVLAGTAIAMPASQLRCPLKFEKNIKLFFKN